MKENIHIMQLLKFKESLSKKKYIYILKCIDGGFYFGVTLNYLSSIIIIVLSYYNNNNCSSNSNNIMPSNFGKVEGAARRSQ